MISGMLVLSYPERLEQLKDYQGQEVVIIKNGTRICGSGAALASIPILQDKAYFEVKIQQGGIWGVGLATERADVNRIPLGDDNESWVICSDNVVRHNGIDVAKPSISSQEGDTLGIAYDHVQLNFYLNGKNMECPISGIRGTIFPAFYVDDGAILDTHFRNFQQEPPVGYGEIMAEKSILEA
ncbi:hypothetical protein QYM36_004782 [Artemia franciscana]|uniref:SPRY domain-containing protein 7 n=1 Tax=Artemia franciscana TaxID=6661 RepID=A0AA88LAJ8_ARTSF|nr:hypothetical protein QYM36_004782 [Artemia franciscana]